MKNNNFFKSVRSAISGLLFAFRKEINLRIQIIIALIATIMALILGLSTIKILALLIIISLVFAAELFNTAIEHLIDDTYKQYKEEYKRIKDISAAAVLITCVAAVVLGIFIFLL